MLLAFVNADTYATICLPLSTLSSACGKNVTFSYPLSPKVYSNSAKMFIILKQTFYLTLYLQKEQVLEPYSSFFPAVFGKTKSRCST